MTVYLTSRYLIPLKQTQISLLLFFFFVLAVNHKVSVSKKIQSVFICSGIYPSPPVWTVTRPHTAAHTSRPRAAGESVFCSSTRQSMSASTKIIRLNRKLPRCGPTEPDCLTWPHLGGANELPRFWFSDWRAAPKSGFSPRTIPPFLSFILLHPFFFFFFYLCHRKSRSDSQLFHCLLWVDPITLRRETWQMESKTKERVELRGRGKALTYELLSVPKLPK